MLARCGADPLLSTLATAPIFPSTSGQPLQSDGIDHAVSLGVKKWSAYARVGLAELRFRGRDSAYGDVVSNPIPDLCAAGPSAAQGPEGLIGRADQAQMPSFAPR